jgi:hypothetical protein
MGDFPIKGSDPSLSFNEIQNPADQLENSLRMPGSEPDRFGRMKEVFQNLTPDDAKDLFNRLQANHDPSAKEFNSTSQAGELLQILQSKFSTGGGSDVEIQPLGERVLFSESKPKESGQKLQLHLDGPAKQKELNSKLATGKERVTDLRPDANNGELAEIQVHRQSNEDLTITHYPNGVQIKQTVHSGLIHPDSDSMVTNGNKGVFQQKGSEVAYEVTAPPGGKVEINKEGQMVVSDASGKEVATMGKNGTVHVHSKHGEYAQSLDGSIRFTTKEKTNPGSLKKGGLVGPGNYEDYGISTNGKTIRFPNGVEYRPGDKTGSLPGLNIPRDIGNATIDAQGHQKYPDIVPTESIDGRPVVQGSPGRYEIPVEGGTFIINPKTDEITFQPTGSKK